MAGATYLELTLRDLIYDGANIIINRKSYLIGQSLVAAIGRITDTKSDSIKTVLDNPDRRLVAYIVGNKLISVFNCNEGRFTPDDGLALGSRLRDEQWHVPYHTTDVERTQIMVFTDVFGDDLRLGILADVPHTGTKPAIFYAVIERISNKAFIVLPDKDSTQKTEVINTTNPLDWIYNSIKASTENVRSTLQTWVTNRWQQMRESTASLEECLKIAEKIGYKILGVIDLDKILTAHRMASSSDRWPMYRKQANTPYSRLDLMLMLAEHATTTDVSTRFKLMAEAGSMMTQYGDLELRPRWINWDRVDFSCLPKII